jgi:hypothetical protein
MAVALVARFKKRRFKDVEEWLNKLINQVAFNRTSRDTA